FFDETFAQTDPEIAGQDLDDVFALARAESRKALLQQLCFRDRPANTMQFVKKLFRFQNRKRRGSSTAIENVECSLAEIAVARGDSMKIGFPGFCSGAGGAT